MNGTDRKSRPREISSRRYVRILLMALGFMCTGVGIAGIILPGLPGVPFLLVAAWAFSRSSERFHRWLYDHRYLGAPIRSWHEHGVVPPRAKIAAVAVMTSSFLLLLYFFGTDAVQPWIAGGCMAAVAVWLLTRPGHPPEPNATDQARQEAAIEKPRD